MTSISTLSPDRYSIKISRIDWERIKVSKSSKPTDKGNPNCIRLSSSCNKVFLKQMQAVEGDNNVSLNIKKVRFYEQRDKSTTPILYADGYCGICGKDSRKQPITKYFIKLIDETSIEGEIVYKTFIF